MSKEYFLTPKDSHPETIPSGVENCPIKRLSYGTWSVEGYSRAAVQTYWRIPEMKLGFDLGAQPWEFMGIPNYFISHTHLDHIAALPVYLARRRMMKMDPPTVYVPESSVVPIEHMLKAFSRLDRGRLPCNLVPLVANQEIEVSRELVVTTHATKHTIPSLGFIVWERRKKLKPEYLALTGEQIRDIRLKGTEVTHEMRLPLLAYTGDTAPEGLDNAPAMYEAEVLITEMTFIAPSHRKEKIHKHGHMHLDDIVARADRFKNKLVICGHFSTRYNERQIQRWVQRALPDRLGGRLHLWL
jgi:ribonuclease Z